jgi:hypothetical protein
MRFVLIIVALVVLILPAAADLTLVDKGASSYEIVLPDGATATARLAAAELQKFVEQSTGAKLPLVKLPSPDKPHILVGPNAASTEAGVVAEDLKPEGFHLRVIGQDVHLVGRDGNGDPTRLMSNYPCQTGTLTAVYEFLERFLGVMFCWDDELGTVVPHHETVTIPVVDVTQAPSFSYRCLPYGPGDATFKVFGRRLRLGWQYSVSHSHNWFRICPAGTYGKDHPEYFALINGERVTRYQGDDNSHSGQVCTSNPEVIQIFVQAAIDYFKANPDRDMFSISPNDGGGFCECDNCRALDGGEFLKDNPKQPVLTDRMIHFYNAIAEGVAKVYPDRMLGSYVYSYYQRPPVRETFIHPNLFLMQATNSAFFQGVGWPEEHAGEKKWRNLAKHFEKYDIYYYGPTVLNVMAPLTTHAIERLQAEQQAGLEGGYLYMGQSYEELGAGHYLMARLMWDGKADARQLEKRYYDALYGPAGADVKKYYDLLEGRLRESFLKGVDCKEPAVKQFGAKVEGAIAPGQVIAAYWPILTDAEKLMKQAEARPLSDLEKQRLARLRDHHDLLVATVRGLVAAGRMQGQGTFNSEDVSLLKDAVALREGAKQRLSAYAPTLMKSLEASDEAGTALVSPAGAFFQMSQALRAPQVMALQTKAPITVDGKADEAAWAQAPAQYFSLTKNASAPTLGARAKLLADDTNLYVFIEGREQDPKKIAVDLTGRDDTKVFDGDNVELIIQPGGSKAYYHVALGAGGSVFDCAYPTGDPAVSDATWDAQAKTKAVVTAQGWNAEIAIPWSSFGSGAPDDKWRLNVYRTRRANAQPDEYTALCPTFGGYHELARFGQLRLLESPPVNLGGGAIDALTVESLQKALRLQLNGGATAKLDADQVYCGGQSLHLSVPQGGLASLTLTAKVKPGQGYRMLLDCFNSKVSLNPEVRDQAPITRVIFRDDTGAAVTPTTGYSWDGAKATEGLDQWRQVAHVFTTPEKTTEISCTIFFHHLGEYWVDEVRIEEL